jgi:hypothetical protein
MAPEQALKYLELQNNRNHHMLFIHQLPIKKLVLTIGTWPRIAVAQSG